jgi:hypothetical protein
VEIKKPNYEISGTEASQKKARNLLNISSEHRLRSENLPFDIDVVCRMLFLCILFVVVLFAQRLHV